MQKHPRLISRRPRRNRRTEGIRSLVRETRLHPENLVLPIFVMEGTKQRVAIKSMPGVFRLSVDEAIKLGLEAYDLGVRAVILFPVVDEKLKNAQGLESANPRGLIPRALKEFRKAIPEMTLMADVALDPYNSDGHDGIVKDGIILNDETIEVLCRQAVTQAQAGIDIVAPSDMMDGRVKAIRQALDAEGFEHVGILSYCAKYASGYYGPFREALDSAPRFGDKKTYQMDPANRREALREMHLDQLEGADMLMVKPALAYLDIISDLKMSSQLPIAAYQVSGEYSMVKAAGEKGWIDADRVMMENLLSIKRAGADVIFTYWAVEAAKKLRG